MNKTSIIILTRNQLDMTRLCLESIRRNTPEPYELIIVDNGSTDSTVSYLREQSDVFSIINESNLGFAKGCNQGLEAATGDLILFLNNDTVVTPEWLSRMLRVLNSDDDIAMVGPVTNYASGQQQISVGYGNVADVDAFAAEHAARHEGYTFGVRRIIGFCMLIKRHVLEETGSFDELYGLGNYEDDDLCLRIIGRGYKIQIVYDSYVHHFGHMTMGSLENETIAHLLAANREKARLKWGKDIHSLLYKEASALTVVVPIGPRTAAASLDRLIENIRALADEWVVVDSGANGDVLSRSQTLTDRIVAAAPSASNDDLSEGIRSAATKPYMLWMEPEDSLAAADRRRLTGLKLLLDGTEDGVAVLLQSDERNRSPLTFRRNRIVRRDARFEWNGVIHEFVLEPGAIIRQEDIVLGS